MSDEPQPPPPSLRLRPRLSASEPNDADPEAGANAPRSDSSASPSGTSELGATPSKTKIRLRPRLNAASTAEPLPPAASPFLPPDEGLPSATLPASVLHVPSATIPPVRPAASVSPVRLKPRLPEREVSDSASPNAVDPMPPPVAPPTSIGVPAPNAGPAPMIPSGAVPVPLANESAAPEVNAVRKAVTPEGGKLKLRSGDAIIGDPPLLVGALPEIPSKGEASSASPGSPDSKPVIKRTPPPVPVAAPPPKRSPPPPRIPHLAALEVSSSRAVTSSVQKSTGKRLFVTALGVAVAVGGAYYGWTQWKDIPPAAPAAVAPEPVTPSETLNSIAAVPGQAIQKAKEVLAQRQERVQEAVETVVAAKESITKPAQPAAAPAPASPPPSMASATATTSLAPGLSASMPIAAAADASAAFREFVANAKISGVADTRALINGRLVRTGEVVDPALGIRFHAVDREAKQLIFRDFNGAQVARRY